MKKYLLLVLAMSFSFSSLAQEIYFSQERMKSFACQVAESIKSSYPKKTLRGLRKDVLKLLRTEINPYVDAYPIPAGISLPDFVSRFTGLPGLPMDRSEYWLPNAFILLGNPKLELSSPTENYYASFIHMARLRHVNFLNGETPAFRLRDEKNLLEAIEAHLPNVANFSFPYRDDRGEMIQQRNAKKPFTLAIGNPKHKKFEEFVTESARYNQFGSPLFLWILEQENFSVTPEKLFEKALEIYGDPMVAIGVINWVISGDALAINRGTSSVITYKLERLVEGNDVPGYHYHFWGYLAQSFIGNKLRVGAMAYVYEKLYQKDIPDWNIDVVALKTGQKIRNSFKRPEICRQ